MDSGSKTRYQTFGTLNELGFVMPLELRPGAKALGVADAVYEEHPVEVVDLGAGTFPR